MRKPKRREIVLLILPVLALVCVGYLTQAGRGKSRFEIESTQVVPIVTDSQFANRDSTQFDTQVNIVIRDNRSFFERRRETTAWGLDLEFLSYLDENGKEQSTNNVYESLKPLRNRRWLVTYQVSLKQLPKSATKVVLTSVIIVNNATRLPVRVPLK